MARPNWEYIRVDVLLRFHPKLDNLSSASKWTLIEMWSHCGQFLTDGFIRDSAWNKIGSASTRRQLAEQGLAERTEGGWQMHDYLEHQRSRAEVEELKAKRSAAGRKGGLAKPGPKPSGKHVLKQVPEQVLKQNGSKTEAEAEAEAEAEQKHPPAEVVTTSVEVSNGALKLPTGRWLTCAECGAVLDRDGKCFACRAPQKASAQ